MSLKYLSDRTQSVIYEGKVSAVRKVISGVPQGFVRAGLRTGPSSFPYLLK